MICPKCKKQHFDKFANNLCQSCYRYYSLGGLDNPIPPKGTIKYDYRGFVICHICGRAYKRLGSHIKESHKEVGTIYNYKELYGLCNNSKTTEKEYSKHMHDLAYKNEMPNRLKITGESTRIKKGEKDKRLGKKSRLQECIERSERYSKNKNN